MTAPVERLSASVITEAATHAWMVAGETAFSCNWDELIDRALEGARDIPMVQVHGAGVTFIEARRTVECAFDEAKELELARGAMDALVANGWCVNVLLPVGMLGHAHEVLRGATLKLHGAWSTERTVHFTSAETP